VALQSAGEKVAEVRSALEVAHDHED
jgi:hypothetical protein